MAKLRAVRVGLTSPTTVKLRAVRVGLTGTAVTTPKLRAVRLGLTGTARPVVNALPSYTGQEPGTVLSYTASLSGGGSADSWTWRVISGASTITGSGATVSVNAPAGLAGATTTIGVTATVGGVTSAEVTATIAALPQIDWWWNGSGWSPKYLTIWNGTGFGFDPFGTAGFGG